MVIGTKHTSRINYKRLTKWLDKSAVDLAKQLRPHMSDDDVICEVDEMNSAFWKRIREVVAGIRYHPPGNA
jgi:hypothetical protein